MDVNIVLKRNREPLPNEDFVVILSYKNDRDYVTNGKIYFYYNEREFKNDNFNLIETRNYHNEIVEEITNDLVFNDGFESNESSYASTEKLNLHHYEISRHHNTKKPSSFIRRSKTKI